MYLAQIYQLNISYNNFRKPRKLINFNLFQSIKITNYAIFSFYGIISYNYYVMDAVTASSLNMQFSSR